MRLCRTLWRGCVSGRGERVAAALAVYTTAEGLTNRVHRYLIIMRVVKQACYQQLTKEAAMRMRTASMSSFNYSM